VIASRSVSYPINVDFDAGHVITASRQESLDNYLIMCRNESLQTEGLRGSMVFQRRTSIQLAVFNLEIPGSGDGATC
jgi:hypothetical protein